MPGMNPAFRRFLEETRQKVLEKKILKDLPEGFDENQAERLREEFVKNFPSIEEHLKKLRLKAREGMRIK